MQQTSKHRAQLHIGCTSNRHTSNVQPNSSAAAILDSTRSAARDCQSERDKRMLTSPHNHRCQLSYFRVDKLCK